MDIVYKYGDEEFVWDANKASANHAKHGVAFEEACEAFFDTFRQGGDASENFEDRQFVLGFSRRRRLLLVVYVERGVRIRIVSARKATSHERNRYEEA